MEENDEEGRKRSETYPDFFAVLRFDKMIGVRQARLQDGLGETCECLVIPAIKNGIVREGKYHWRLVLSACRMKTSPVPYVTHCLAPFLNEAQQKYMKYRKYDVMMPIIGDIVKDVYIVKYPPKFDAADMKDMNKSTKQILLERKGKTFEEFTGQKYNSFGTAYEQRMKERSETRTRLRDKLFKLKGKEDEE